MTDPIPVKNEHYETSFGDRFYVDSVNDDRVEYHFYGGGGWTSKRNVSLRLFQHLVRNREFTKVEKS